LTKNKSRRKRVGFIVGAVALVIVVLIVGRWLGLGTTIRQVNRLISTEPKPETARAGAPTPVKEFQQVTLDELFRSYVNDGGWVDYAGLGRERDKLDSDLAGLAGASPQSFSTDHERLAFWIDAYNAFTLADVLDHVYGKFKSVQSVPGFFDRNRHRVGGASMTLDDMEQRARSFSDPRVHFALVCASTSCPKLQPFAYTGSDLDKQLDRAARDFLADPSRGLRLDRLRNEIFLSSLFKWYAGDFTMASSKAGRAVAPAKAYISGTEGLAYIRQYTPAEVSTFIDEKKPGLSYLPYDWTLNAQELHASASEKTK